MEIPVGYCQANLRFTGAAVSTGAEITMGFDIDDATDTPAAIGAEIIAGWQTSDMDAMQVITCVLTSVLVKFGPVDIGPSAEVPTNTPGTNPADGLPPNTAYLVQKATEFGGRAGRGRMFIPGVPENNVAETGLLVPTAMTNLTSRLAQLETAWQAVGNGMVVLHTAGSPLTEPSPVTDLVAQSRVATQRRRLRR